MVVVMHTGASEEQIQHVVDRLVALGFDIHRSTGASQTVTRTQPMVDTQPPRGTPPPRATPLATPAAGTLLT